MLTDSKVRPTKRRGRVFCHQSSAFLYFANLSIVSSRSQQIIITGMAAIWSSPNCRQQRHSGGFGMKHPSPPSTSWTLIGTQGILGGVAINIAKLPARVLPCASSSIFDPFDWNSSISGVRDINRTHWVPKWVRIPDIVTRIVPNNLRPYNTSLNIPDNATRIVPNNLRPYNTSLNSCLSFPLATEYTSYHIQGT